MKRRLALAIGAAALGAIAASADTEPPPYVSMRNLQVLQEQIAHGDLTAQAAQGKLLDHIADGFRAAPPEAWTDVRNSRAAVLFLLSGGNPDTIRAILKRADVAPETDRLLKGALAYDEGQDDLARALLEPIDPQTLPASLGGHVAFVKASLSLRDDSAKAIKLLDLARLLAPGSLAEEASLRTEVFLLIGAGAVDKAMLLSRQYIRRFGASSYAQTFKQRFAAAAAKMAMAGDIVAFAKLDSMVKEMPPAEARNFYLSVARSSILNGKTDAARFAADKALDLSKTSPADKLRADLYKATAQITSGETDAGMAILSGLGSAHLAAEDAALREAALTIGTAIRVDQPLTDPVVKIEPAPADDPAKATFDHARNALDTADQLLQERAR